MKRIAHLIPLLLALILVSSPSYAQDGTDFEWPAPLNDGTATNSSPLLPPANIMPTLPLSEALLSGTVLFNAERFGEEYRIQNLTLDDRLYAYNITTERGVFPVSPNGQYGITTISAYAPGEVTCGIIDLLTNLTVDEFDIDGACQGMHWSPDNTRLIFTVSDENGIQSLGIRQNGQTQTFRPVPTPESDLAGGILSGDSLYVLEGWVSDTVFAMDIVSQGIISERLYVSIDDLETAFPVISVTEEQVSDRYVKWRPAQPISNLYRGLWVYDVTSGKLFELAPDDSTAVVGDFAPNGEEIVYWAATKGEFGRSHPLRLVIVNPETETQTVLIQFDGPADILNVIPGLIEWKSEGIYFHVSPQPDAISELELGTYLINTTGENLQFVTPHLLVGSVK